MAAVLATGTGVGTRVGIVVGTVRREPDTGVFRLSSGTKVGLGVLVTSGVAVGVAVGLAAGLARPSESPPNDPQPTAKNIAKNARTANLDTMHLSS